MKKILSVILCLLFVFSLTLTAVSADEAATPSVVINAAETVKRGEEIVVTVALKDVAAFKSMLISPVFDKDVFELVSNEWIIKDAAISNPLNANNQAAISYSEAVEKNENVFKFVLKAKDDAKLGKIDVSAKVIIKNGTANVDATVIGKKFRVICKDGKHEYAANDWKVTVAATCEANGTEQHLCKLCEEPETRTVKALGHKFANPKVDKAPTCTTAGIETSTCVRCVKTSSKVIEALGHKMGEFTVVTEATCTAEGKKESVCETCQTKVEEAIAAKGHTFGEAVVTKEATKDATGIKTSTCSVCNESKEEVIPAIVVETAKSEILLWVAVLAALLVCIIIIIILLKKNRR